jgi:hypothetical protein
VSVHTTAAFEAARAFATHGFRVFPVHTVFDGRCSCGRDCSSPGKHPRTKRGVTDATTDERALLRWHDDFPDANWATACGDRFAVVDIDSKAGADPEEVTVAHALAGPTVRTGEATTGDLESVRGAHVYCLNGVPTGQTPVPGVEIRAEGAYVLLPGSRHASGVAYEWKDDARPWSVPLAEVPDALRPTGGERMTAPAIGEVIPHGERDTTLTSLAGTMRRRGMSEAAILAALRAENVARCHPPLPDGQVCKIARSVGRYAPADGPRTPPADAGAALREVSDLLGLADPFVASWRALPATDAPLTATTKGGVVVRWEQQRDLANPRTLLLPLLIEGIPAPPKMPTAVQAAQVLALLVRAAATMELHDALDEARDWLDGFAGVARPVEADLADPAKKYAAAVDLEEHRPAWGDPPLLLIDMSTGLHYLRRGDLATYVRRDRRVTIAMGALTARLAEVSVTAFDLQTWEPDVPRAEAGRAYVRCYRWRPQTGGKS